MNVAVVGATGVVGETILRVLEERRIRGRRARPVRFASRAKARCVFAGETLDVRATDADALAEFDVVFFAGGEELSERYAPATASNADASSSTTARRSVCATACRSSYPTSIPQAIAPGDGLFPVGNCTAIILCSALAPIRDAAGVRTVRVATYQAASGAGRAGLDELLAGERAPSPAKPSRNRTSFHVRWRETSFRKWARSTPRVTAVRNAKCATKRAKYSDWPNSS